MSTQKQFQKAIDELAKTMVDKATEEMQWWVDSDQVHEDDLVYTHEDYERLIDNDIDNALFVSFKKQARRAKLPLHL